MQRIFPAMLLLSVMLAAFCEAAQTSASETTNSAPTMAKSGDPIAGAAQQAEQQREFCINGRRIICGKILRVQPDGLVVESGYTNLLREPLIKSWLVPGTVVATRPENQIERNQPGAICVGTVFLTDLPRGRGGKAAKPKQFDYVILEGYPAGQHTYASVGNIQKTVRCFSGDLKQAVAANLNSHNNAAAVSK